MMLKVVTLFSGYDSQCQSLDRLGIDYSLVGWSDIDSDVISVHNSLYPEHSNKNLGDVSKIDWSAVGDFDLMTYSSPCTSFSAAGLQEGGEEGSGTESSLLWECKRVIQAKHPKYLIFENVKNLLSEKFMPTFNKWIEFLSDEGYSTKYTVLNAVDFGIPQNRERVIAVSCLDGLKDFYFPSSGKATEKTLSDVLETNLPAESYFSQEKTKEYINSIRKSSFSFNVPTIVEDFYANRDVRLYDEYSPTLRSERTGLKVIEYAVGAIRGRMDEIENRNTQRLELSSASHINTLTTVQKDNVIVEMSDCLRMRYLTPREAFRFMDVSDENIDKIFSSGVSKTSLLKMAGNSICVGVLVEVFRNLLTDTTNDTALF